MEKDYLANVDEIRDREYPMLNNTTYLDHAGTTIYSRSFVEEFSKNMISNLYGNPHSASHSSALSTRLVQSIRLRVLEFFKADPKEFDIVFVANATASIKMVTDIFRDSTNNNVTKDQCGFWYGYHRDSHTSLVGVRQVSSASVCFESDEEVEDWLSGKLETPDDSRYDPRGRLGLFAYPAQSNMNGRRLPLSWPARIRQSSNPALENVYTLLDAAAYVTTAQLDLSDAMTAPDFTALSFYKIFGFPDLGR